MPWYLPQANEVTLFEHAARQRLPVLLKGPTGCGKTRFVRHMAERLARPLVTVACQEDLGAADLTGRWLLEGGSTVWRDGPVTRAVREGAICYLDEVLEARPDVLTLLHPLTDDRRILPLERLGTELAAPDTFMVVVSYNPGYVAAARQLKESTRQRFVSIALDYPAAPQEESIVAREGGCDAATARTLVRLGAGTRALRGHGLGEGASTRMLVYAAQLTAAGLPLREAVEATLVEGLTDDADLTRALRELAKGALA
jgi:nitric oxide reductase NorQ protein